MTKEETVPGTPVERGPLTDGIAQYLFDKSAPIQTRPRIRDVIERPLTFPFISVDDHLCEPPDAFEGRLPGKYRDLTPRVFTGEDGCDYWQFGDRRVLIGAANVIAGWEVAAWQYGPITFADARPGTYDIDERVRDMDINGAIASLGFPSMVFGFAGQLFMRLPDQEFGLAAMRAYNDWVADGWWAPHPQRIIPCQVAWLLDPVIAAREIRRNAARGFRAVTFTEDPSKLGLPPISDEYWEPFLAACSETETVINLHTGSSSQILPGGL